jgi:hypothetical protein
MVDMCMSQAQCAQARRPNGKVPVIQLPLGFGPLKHAAIDENAGIFRLKQEAGSCHGSGGAKKMKAKGQEGPLSKESFALLTLH